MTYFVVYSIGLQVVPGFLAFKKGGFNLNMLAMGAIFISVVITIILHFTTSCNSHNHHGRHSPALVTNTPGLGAAQQANSDFNGIDAPDIAMGYAVAYPLGAVGANSDCLH